MSSSTVRDYTPDGWASTHITMGQVWEGAPFSINNTAMNFDSGAYSSALGSYFTYFGTGFASDTRSILSAAALDTPKIQGLSNATSQLGGSNPVLVIYSNDFSTNESAANTVPDISGAFASKQLANLALQSAAFEKQNVKNGIEGSILFSPDGIGAMAKNLIYNKVSPNADWASDPNAIIAVSGKDLKGNEYTKTFIDYKKILGDAVDAVWALKDDANYKAIIDFPKNKPDVNSLNFSNDISDYMMVQAWIIKQFAPKSELATVTNLWAGPWAGAGSMLTATDAQLADFASTAAQAYNTLGWSKANPYLDFIAFDKYERDETSGIVTGAQGGAQSFTETAWNNSLKFFNEVTGKIMPADKQAIMLWQMPSSGLPSKSPSDANMLDQGWSAASSGGKDLNPGDIPHFGITESYFFGDKELADLGIADAVAKIVLPGGKTYGERLTSDSAWSPGKGLIDAATGAVDPLLSKVFAILWGGGNTSTPISYRPSQWSGISGNSGADVSSELNVKNKFGTAVLSIMDDLKAYDAASRPGDGSGSVGAGAPEIAGINGLVQTLDLNGAKSDYKISYLDQSPSSAKSAMSLYITDLVKHRNETFTTSNVERLHFDDVTTAFDLSGHAGQVHALYDALLNRAGDKGGLGYWIGQLDSGASLKSLAQTFLDSGEFKALGTQTNAEFVNMLYTHGLERAGDEGGLSYWIGQLVGGSATRADIAVAFAVSAEEIGQVISEVGSTGLDYIPFQQVEPSNIEATYDSGILKITGQSGYRTNVSFDGGLNVENNNAAINIKYITPYDQSKISAIDYSALTGSGGTQTVFQKSDQAGVGIIGSAARDYVNVQLSATGNYSLGAEDEMNLVGPYANISGVNHGNPTGAGYVSVLGSVAMTVQQHNAFSQINGMTFMDKITLYGSGDYTPNPSIETYERIPSNQTAVLVGTTDVAHGQNPVGYL